MSDRHEEFAVGDEVGLNLRLASGAIALRPSHGAVVTVDITGPKAADFVVEQRGHVISVHQPPRTGFNWRDHHIDITAPAGSDVTADTASADVTSEVSLASVKVKTSSGDIELNSADRGVLDTASGDVVVDSASDDLRVKTASGTITLGQVATFDAATASGDVIVTAVDGRAKAKTASGDVRIGRASGDTVNTKTVSGNISVVVPTGRAVDVDIRSLSGTVSLPSEPGEATSAGGPDIALRAHSVSGDVEVLTSA